MRKTLITGAALAALAAPSLAACGSSGSYNDQAYCTTADGRVLDPSYCDRSSLNYSDLYLFMLLNNSSRSYRPGQVINQQIIHDNRTTIVHVNDRQARQKAGLPSTGTVKSGQSVKVPKSASSPAKSGSSPKAPSGGSSSKVGSSPKAPSGSSPKAPSGGGYKAPSGGGFKAPSGGGKIGK
jgi:hypothetical protein